MSELTVRRRRRTLTGEWDDEVFETVFGRIGAWTEHTPIRVGHF